MHADACCTSRSNACSVQALKRAKAFLHPCASICQATSDVHSFVLCSLESLQRALEDSISSNTREHGQEHKLRITRPTVCEMNDEAEAVWVPEAMAVTIPGGKLCNEVMCAVLHGLCIRAPYRCAGQNPLC